VTAETEPLFKNILCPVDSSPTAAAAAELALAFARHSGSRLTTFHVIEGVQPADGISRDEAILATAGKLNLRSHRHRPAYSRPIRRRLPMGTLQCSIAS
jgi:nucleotide-binding universal stress UspA family protein